MVRAARGQREVDGQVEAIEDKELVARLKAVARSVTLRAAVLTALLTAAVAVCPA